MFGLGPAELLILLVIFVVLVAVSAAGVALGVRLMRRR